MEGALARGISFLFLSAENVCSFEGVCNVLQERDRICPPSHAATFDNALIRLTVEPVREETLGNLGVEEFRLRALLPFASLSQSGFATSRKRAYSS